MYTRILVGVDGSKESMKALREGISLAQILDATVDVLFVISPQSYSQSAHHAVSSHDPDGQNQYISLLQQEENAILNAIKAAAADLGSEVRLHTRVGDAVEGLVEFAASNQIELIVVGSSGKGMASRFLLGSVSTGVVHQSQVSVLVIKPS